MDRSKIALKAHKILVNLGISVTDPDYSFLLDNAIAAREAGLSWKRIEAMCEEREIEGGE
jgi:hypothetical protein